MDVNAFLAQDEQKDLLRLLTAGSVDDGKSTLIGRLLYDSKLVYEDQLAAVVRDSKRVGHAGDEIDYALLLDGLKSEREQGITIDVAYRYFATNKRKFIIADTPGHEQYTRNMATGASTANLAVILADATKGIITQTKRHTFIASLLGIRHIVLAVNKMDLAGFDQTVFDRIVEDFKSFIIRLNIPDVHFIPLCALKGDNVVEKSGRMPWYQGPPLLKYLEDVQAASDRDFIDLRFPVQYVTRPSHNFRGYAGTLASGILRKGDTVMALPGRKESRVVSILTADRETDYAFPPQAITVTLADEIDISRGDMLVHPNNIPTMERRFEAMLLWMDEEPMDQTKQFFLKQTTRTTKAKIDAIRYKVDVNTLRQSRVERLALNEIGRVVVTTSLPLFYDAYAKNRQTGAFVLIDPITHNTSAVGMIVDRISAETLPMKITSQTAPASKEGQSNVLPEERMQRMNQTGKTIWITGLHGSGKLPLAYLLERVLFDQNKTVVVLEGQSVRSGLSRELDFTPADRAEHLRRVAETARILNDHNIIVIAAFISPDRLIRRQIADIIGQGRFIEVYTEADLDHCRQHDRNGLYEKAEKGLIHFLPGIDMDFHEPESPDFHFNTVRNDLNAAAQAVIKKL